MSTLAPAQAARQDEVLTQSEFAFRQRDFDCISGLLLAETGISLPPAKTSLVYSRLAKRLRLLKLQDFAQYCALITSPEGQAESREMIAALTTNVTRFFREPHHFEHLRTQVLPGLAARARAGERIRLWSAASSSGQEAYSMALTLLSVMPEAPRHDIKILATDIDPNVLAVGEAGVYDKALVEEVPAALRSRWFQPAGASQLRVAPELAKLVSFRKMNLIGQWPMRGKFQVIFCRNVVIYFELATQERIWSRFAPLLADPGMLYIGHSERVSGPAEAVLHNEGITIYRLGASKGNGP